MKRRSHARRSVERLVARLHVPLIAAAVVAAGTVASRLLSELGAHPVSLRLAVSVVCAYSLFFLLVRLWVWYASESAGALALRVAREGGAGFDGVVEDLSRSRVSRGGLAIALFGALVLALPATGLALAWLAPSSGVEATVYGALALLLAPAARRANGTAAGEGLLAATWTSFTLVGAAAGLAGICLDLAS